MTFRSIRCLTLGAALAALAAAPMAAEKVKEGGFGVKAGKSTGPLLTRAQLRECMALQDRRQAEAAENARLRADIDREKGELQREGEALKAQLDALDRTSQEAVDQYNERAAARDKRIDAFEARANDFNKRVESVQALNAQFAANCDNRRFDEADEIAIRKGK